MKPDLKTILQTIGTVFALITGLLGALYWLRGDLILSGLISVVLVTLLYFIVDQLARRKVEVRKQRFGPVSVVLWAGYILVSLPLSILLVHALNVEIHHRTEVQRAAAEKIAALEGMVASYDSLTQSEVADLKLSLDWQLNALAYDPTDSSVRASLANEPFKLPESLLNALTPEMKDGLERNWLDNKQSLFNQATAEVTKKNKAFIGSAGRVFADWHRLKVPLAYSSLDTLLTGNLKALQASYAEHTTRPGGAFTYALPEVPMLMAEPLALWQRTKPYPLLLAVAAFHLLLLLPYLLQRGAGAYVKQAGHTLQERFPEAFEL